VLHSAKKVGLYPCDGSRASSIWQYRDGSDRARMPSKRRSSAPLCMFHTAKYIP